MSDERTPWATATQMLAWFYAMHSRASDIPAIDPGRERIDGLRVDRDERAWKVQSVRQALTHLVATQGSNTGALLLWMHLRPTAVRHVRTKRKGWVARQEHAVPLWDLHEEVQLTQRGAVEAYWEALRIVEEFALTKEWIAVRTERRSREALHADGG